MQTLRKDPAEMITKSFNWDGVEPVKSGDALTSATVKVYDEDFKDVSGDLLLSETCVIVSNHVNFTVMGGKNTRNYTAIITNNFTSGNLLHRLLRIEVRNSLS